MTEENVNVKEAGDAPKEITIEQVLKEMKKTDLTYCFKEKGNKHQYKKEDAIVVTFIDRPKYISLYTWDAEKRKYVVIELRTLKDFEDNIDIK